MTNAAQLSLPVPSYDVERLNLSLSLYTAHGRDQALASLKQKRLKDFSPVIVSLRKVARFSLTLQFDDRERVIFEDCLEKYGGLDTIHTSKEVHRRPAEVLRYSYKWKNQKLQAENEALRQHRTVTASHARQNKTLGAPSLGLIRPGAGSGKADDEVSLFGADYVSSHKMQCAACSTRLGDIWWKCPRTISGEAMCESCGANYRKYGVISFAKAEDSKRPEKNGKRLKEERSGASTPVPAPPPKLPPCAVCKRMEPKSLMARCKTCTFSVHAGELIQPCKPDCD